MSLISTISEDYYVENNIRYVFIDGYFCKKIDNCYATLQQQLSIPDYFGKNLDALEEVLADLDWIEEEKIKIIISNPDGLLSYNMDKRNDFLEILNSCENEKLEIIYLGKEGIK